MKHIFSLNIKNYMGKIPNSAKIKEGIKTVNFLLKRAV